MKKRVTVSNNFTQQRQSGFNICTRDKFATHLRQENFISNDIVIYSIFFLRLVISFPCNSLYTQAVAYTTYFKLGEPVFWGITKIGFSNPKESVNWFCGVSFLNRSIRDFSNHGASKQTEESTLEVDSLVPLTRHDPKDLGSICLVKKRKICFLGFSQRNAPLIW